jgi:hypothetical protein
VVGCKDKPGGALAGHYEGQGLVLDLRQSGAGVEGTIVLGGRRFDLQAMPAGGALAGQFKDGEKAFDVTLERAEGGLVLETGGTRYRLTRQGGGGGGGGDNPLARGAGSPAAAGQEEVAAALSGAGAGQAAGAGSGSGSGAASPPPAAASTWAGSYRGDVAGTTASLKLAEEGSDLSGTIDADGYVYRLRAKASGTTASGVFEDPQTGGQGQLGLERIASGVAVSITVPGAPQALRLEFHENGGGGPGPAGAGGGTATAGGGGQHDPVLVGTWTRNETMSSGDFSMVTKHWMVIRADGTYAVGTGGSTASGSAGSLESGGGTGSSGRWRTQGNVVLIEDGGSYQPYARYYVEGNSLMITSANGSREVWHRR